MSVTCLENMIYNVYVCCC
uniref:Uncharacterized protein n=1 Tax=Anguilla anguilla TaxID=7936 RepID=A0A0E9U126_ANGAN